MKFLALAILLLCASCKRKTYIAPTTDWTGIPADRACHWNNGIGQCLAEGKEYHCLKDDEINRVACREIYAPCNPLK